MRYTKLQFESEGLLSVDDIDQFQGPLDKIGILYHHDKRGQKPLPVKRIMEMVNLQYLGIKWLRNEDYKTFFEALSHLPRLKELEITVGEGQHLLSSIGNLPTLEYLKISGKSLGEFPKEIEKMTNLRALELWIYAWENIGRRSHLAALGGLSNLEEMVIDAKFNTPSGLSNVKQLKTLEARGLPNELSGISELTCLEDLILEYGQVDANVSAIAGQKSLKRLKVGTRGAITFPPSWAELIQLEELDLWDCNLPQVPDVISTIPNLKRLSLGRNQVKQIPDWICNFRDLEELGLSFNAIQVLPDAFANLQKLQKINLDTNALAVFPPAFLQMPSLKVISLYENTIVDFPLGPLNFPQLEQIVLSKNKIAKIPWALLGLPKGEISLEGNPFAMAAGYKLDQIVHAVSKADHAPDARLTLLALSVGDVDRALQSATLEHLVIAINDHENKLRAFGLDALNRFLQDPFDAEVLPRAIQVLGQTKSHPNLNYEKILRSKGIIVNEGPVAAVDIVVIAEKPGDALDTYLKAGAKPATLAQLVGFVEALEKPWLRTQAAAKPALADNFLALLESGAPENINVAFEMMASGGLPETAISAVLAISLFHPDAAIKKAATQAVQAYASPALKAFLAANKRNVAAMSEDKLIAYSEHLMTFEGISAPRFAKMAMACRKELRVLYLPYMSGAELLQYKIRDGELRFYNEGFKALPPGVFELNALPKLTLEKVGIKALPEGLTRIKGLRELSLADNKLNSLPDDVADLQSLEVLDLSSNFFKEIPAVLGKLPRLQQLRMGFNTIKSLDSGLATFPALTHLHLHYCRFAKFPAVLTEMPGLELLEMGHDGVGTGLKELPDTIGNMRGLKSLQLQHQDFAKLPDAIAQLPLETLDLFGAKLHYLPDAICKIKTLKHLILGWCIHIPGLPDAIGELSNLESLDISNTGVAALPPSFAALQQLQTLDLTKLVFDDQAATIGILLQLKGLRTIRLDNYYDPNFIAALRAALKGVSVEV